MTPKLTGLKLRTETDKADTKARVKAATEKKVKANETIEDAWIRILSMKNSDTDQAKLIEVRDAMVVGTAGRLPTDSGKRFSKAEALRIYKVLAESQREEKLRKLVEDTPANYRLITDAATLESVVEDIRNEPIIAVDTETTGLDVYVDVIVGVSITLPTKDYHVYIPVEPTEDPRAMSSEYVLNTLKPIMESEDIRKVLHNAN